MQERRQKKRGHALCIKCRLSERNLSLDYVQFHLTEASWKIKLLLFSVLFHIDQLMMCRIILTTY